jgi:rRNA maturation protein Nop10
VAGSFHWRSTPTHVAILTILFSVIAEKTGLIAMTDGSTTRSGHGPVLLQGRLSTCPKCGGQVRNNKPRGRYECKLSACGWMDKYRHPIEPMLSGPSSSKIGQAWSRQDETGIYKNYKCPICGEAVRYQHLRPGPVIIACSNELCSWTVDNLRRS